MQALSLKLKRPELIRLKQLLKKCTGRVMIRALTLLNLHQGQKTADIARILNIDPKTVTTRIHAYHAGGLESALYDKPRPGKPRSFDDRDRAHIVALACTQPPPGRCRWTLDLLVEEIKNRGLLDKNISRNKVHVILNEHHLKPWQEKMWCIGELNETYVQRMEDVLDVYERPYNPDFPVVCLDEKPVALIAEIKLPLKMTGPGKVKKKIMNTNAMAQPTSSVR